MMVAKYFFFHIFFQNEKLSQLVSKLDQLSNQNKKQDLLDMELEEAESRYENANLIHFFFTNFQNFFSKEQVYSK